MTAKKNEKTDFNRNLRALRKRSGYTITEMAGMLNVAVQTYNNYEVESIRREPSYSTLIKISEILHVSIDKLFKYEPTKADTYLNLCTHFGFKIVNPKKQEELRNRGMRLSEINLEYKGQIYSFTEKEFITAMKQLYKAAVKTPIISQILGSHTKYQYVSSINNPKIKYLSRDIAEIGAPIQSSNRL